MFDLIAVRFEGKHRASEVLEELLVLNADWTINLTDAVAAYRTDDGRLRLDQSVQPTEGEGAALGGLLGGLLGALLAAPFTAGATAAAAAALVGVGALGFGLPAASAGAEDARNWKNFYGVSDDFVKQVGGMLQPGQSAIFAMFESSDAVAVAEHFRGYGGTVLSTTLAPEQAEQVQRILAPVPAPRQ